jgi:hypothetical protein
LEVKLRIVRVVKGRIGEEVVEGYWEEERLAAFRGAAEGPLAGAAAST